MLFHVSPSHGDATYHEYREFFVVANKYQLLFVVEVWHLQIILRKSKRYISMLYVLSIDILAHQQVCVPVK